MQYTIIPAVLTDTIEAFEDEVAKIDSVADIVQIDYVDGFFAPELTCCEAKVIEDVEIIPPFEVQLMVQDPIRQVLGWKRAGAERIIGHVEEMEDQEAFVEKVSNAGLYVGLALDVDTAVSEVEDHLFETIDVLLLMGHEVGVQATEFEPSVLDKIAQVRTRFPDLEIEVDGGVTLANIPDMIQAGANSFAVGSAIFNSKDPVEAYKQMCDILP